jgi:hypothetical protein
LGSSKKNQVPSWFTPPDFADESRMLVCARVRRIVQRTVLFGESRKLVCVLCVFCVCVFRVRMSGRDGSRSILRRRSGSSTSSPTSSSTTCPPKSRPAPTCCRPFLCLYSSYLRCLYSSRIPREAWKHPRGSTRVPRPASASRLPAYPEALGSAMQHSLAAYAWLEACGLASSRCDWRQALQ